jgi:hypothetical protein
VNTIANLGIVVGPEGWNSHYVRHELIHHWQGYKLGLMERWFGPKWLMEGMAYSLSDDPRGTLVEPNQTYRASFEEWYEDTGSEDIWLAAEDEMQALDELDRYAPSSIGPTIMMTAVGTFKKAPSGTPGCRA